MNSLLHSRPQIWFLKVVDYTRKQSYSIVPQTHHSIVTFKGVSWVLTAPMTFLQQGSAKHPPALCKLTSRKKVNSLISFVFVAEQNSIVCMNHIFLIRSSVDGHWGWFYFLTIVSGAAMTTFMESCSLVEYGTLWVHTQQWYVTGAYGRSSFRVSIVGELTYTSSK